MSRHCRDYCGLLQVSRGVARQEKLWADSPHCEHFRKHPDEYRALIEAFSMSLQARS